MEFKEDIADTQQSEEHFHVLAVDDSLIDRKILEKLLTVSSYQVTCVESANKALEYLGLLDNIHNESKPSQPSKEGLKVNLIMTDYSMPGMSGYDLLKRVKGSSWKDVPVVVMSSENISSRINMCLEGGAEDFLLKPVRLSDLKKLEPHLLKTTSHSCKNVQNDSPVFITTENNGINIKGSNSIKGRSKRKAMSPEPSERRPKIKI